VTNGAATRVTSDLKDNVKYTSGRIANPRAFFRFVQIAPDGKSAGGTPMRGRPEQKRRAGAARLTRKMLARISTLTADC